MTFRQYYQMDIIIFSENAEIAQMGIFSLVYPFGYGILLLNTETDVSAILAESRLKGAAFHRRREP